LEVVCYVVVSGVLDVVLLVVIHKIVEYMWYDPIQQRVRSFLNLIRT